MSKVEDFFKKAAADENARKELAEIFGEKSALSRDEQLAKAAELASKLDLEITADEFSDYFSELGDDELDAAAGGKGLAIPQLYLHEEISDTKPAKEFIGISVKF